MTFFQKIVEKVIYSDDCIGDGVSDVIGKGGGTFVFI